MSLIRKIYYKIVGGRTSTPSNSIIKDWEEAGKRVPPPHLIKQLAISNLNEQLNYNLFIETGTFYGDMVEAQKTKFSQIFSIELGEQLFLNATTRFKHDKNVTILQGDSGDVLIELCAKIDEPAIFWLDGHYSEGITAKGNKICPIYEELSAIFNSKYLAHILLIDDARLFVGENDYPTISEVSEFIKKHKPEAKINCENDIIYVFI